MPEWWTYSVSDIQSFSLHSYYRLFELYNRAIWPAQILAVGLGLGMGSGLHLPHRGSGRHIQRGRFIAGILPACWLWIAIAFHATRYRTLTWTAVYFAWGFGLQAALLVWTAIRGRLAFERHPAGLAVFLFALAVQPLLGLLFGRSWSQIEVFGVAPDPTAVATLGVLLLASGRVPWELMALPLLWCAISGATLLSMKAPDAWIPLAAAALSLSVAVAKALAHRRQRSRQY
jgi:uncharacterized protein DUF6064